MRYKGFNIMANTKSYSVWSLDDKGQLKDLEHDLGGHYVISYIFSNDDILGGEYGDFSTINDTKRAIDKLEKGRIMGSITDRELKIERLLDELASELDKEYNVKNEFYSVLLDCVNRHIELINEQ